MKLHWSKATLNDDAVRLCDGGPLSDADELTWCRHCVRMSRKLIDEFETGGTDG